MSLDQTALFTQVTQLMQRDRRLKRVAITIRSKNIPDRLTPGYVLINELGYKNLSFFASQKFGIDEELIVHFTVGDNQFEYLVSMLTLHEQISSGKIMNAVPTIEEPFPVRKFFRCYARITKNLLLQETPPVSEEAPIDGQLASPPDLQLVPSVEPLAAELAQATAVESEAVAPAAEELKVA